MGGHALKLKTNRKSPEEYRCIKDLVLRILHENDIVASVPREVPGKTSYGDLDVLYVSKVPNIQDLILKMFRPEEIHTNGPYISFNSTILGHSDFQIDMIRCTPENYEMSKFYLSYGDLGGILGRICNAYGLKFGSDGLWCISIH